jgi:hypothetical protein
MVQEGGETVVYCKTVEGPMVVGKATVVTCVNVVMMDTVVGSP